MLNKYRLFQRANGVFYCQDNQSGQQRSLRTKNRRAAEKLLHAQNEWRSNLTVTNWSRPCRTP
jgi:hypothetical protein